MNALQPAPNRISIVSLVRDLPLPYQATARTRAVVPPGYGVQEQCLPFVAASALGLLVPSPITWGVCRQDQVPCGARSFAHPLSSETDRSHRVFYVFDDASCGFTGNCFTLGGFAPLLQEPGLSFFDRPDQANLFKLHLPYIWRTTEGVSTLFTTTINRGLLPCSIRSGLVETDWYTSPVNLIFEMPAAPVHVSKGDIVAQAIPVAKAHRLTALEVAPAHARITREIKRQLLEWDELHAADRSAYKALARQHELASKAESGSCPLPH